jgi:hypothetical protein
VTSAPEATSAPAVTAATPPPRPRGRSRRVPAEVWRAVWARDGGHCVWPLQDGGVCGSTHKLQLDHIDGWALGGETTAERCRILCEGHNDRHARELYGDELMNRYTRPKGPRCSEPFARYRPGASLAESRALAGAFLSKAHGATGQTQRSGTARARTGA